MSGMILFIVFVGALTAFVNGILARAIAGIWLDGDKARIAGFAFVVGGFVMSGLNRGDFHASDLFAFAIGYTAGLLGLWWLFFKRKSYVA